MKKNTFFLLFVFLIIGIACERQQDFLHKHLSWGFAVEGFPITKNSLKQLEKDTKMHSDMILFYLQWPALSSPTTESLVGSLNAINEIGAIPCLSWEPMYYHDKMETMIPYEQILKGLYDDYLISKALEIKSWGKPLIIRFAHEMNLSRYHWGVSKDEYGPGNPEIYIKMFRYVVDIFRKHHVDNVRWAFCPNVDSVPGAPWNKASNYYPGDPYVDILGMDGYNWDITPEIAAARHLTWTKPWQSFEQIFQSLYMELKKLAPNKPVMVFETASVDRSGHQKSEWIKEALITAKKWNLLGIIWFEANKEEDWRIE